MKLTLAKLSDFAFLAACVVVAFLGIIKLWERVRVQASPASAAAANPVESIDGLDVDLRNVQLMGDSKSRFVLIEVSDFDCPYCRRHAIGPLGELKAEFVDTGKVRYGFMHFPLDGHPNAIKASVAAECAGLQGRFWPMHDRLFRDRLRTPAAFLDHARALHLDASAFSSCIGEGLPDRIAKGMQQARAWGIESTPTFLLGEHRDGEIARLTTRIRGAYPASVFREALARVTSRQ